MSGGLLSRGIFWILPSWVEHVHVSVVLIEVDGNIGHVREIHTPSFSAYLVVDLEDHGRFRTDIGAVETAYIEILIRILVDCIAQFYPCHL